MLTKQDVEVLCAIFPTEAHQFTQGYIYLSEEAIFERLTEVDPGWSSEIVKVDHRDDQVYVQMRLTIKGVSRDNIGSALVERKWSFKKKDAKSAPSAEEWTLREVNEAEKSATTDALKRAARSFGIGKYILTIPKNIQNQENLKALGNYLYPQTQRAAPTPVAPAKPVTPAVPSSGNPFDVAATQNALIQAVRAAGFTSNTFPFLFANIIPGKTLTGVRDAHPHITPEEFMKRLPGVAALYAARLDHETHADDDGHQPDPDDDPSPTTGARTPSPAVGTRNGASAAANPSTDDVRNVLNSPTGSSTRKPHPLHGERVEIERIEAVRERRGVGWEHDKWAAHGTAITPNGIEAAFTLTIWPEDARKLREAGHAIDWPSSNNGYEPFITHPNPLVIVEMRGPSSGLCIRSVESITAIARKSA